MKRLFKQLDTETAVDYCTAFLIAGALLVLALDYFSILYK